MTAEVPGAMWATAAANGSSAGAAPPAASCPACRGGTQPEAKAAAITAENPHKAAIRMVIGFFFMFLSRHGNARAHRPRTAGKAALDAPCI